MDTLFGHNGLNQITSVTGSAAPTYDDRGNMDSDGTTSFGYDQYNRLTSAGSASFDYDPLGRLYQSTGPSGTARRQYDGAAMIAVYNTSGGLTERYVHGPGMDEPLVMYAGSGTSNRTFLHADARGSIIAHTNSSGARTAVLTYDEFGNPGPTNTGRYQYTGQTWLSDAGLYHYKNRAYNPRLMRFMQTDPIGQTGGINLYAYVGGDPVNMMDPWGLSRIKGNQPNYDHCRHTGRKTKSGAQILECWNSIPGRFGFNNSGGVRLFGGGPGGGGGGANNDRPNADQGEDCRTGGPLNRAGSPPTRDLFGRGEYSDVGDAIHGGRIMSGFSSNDGFARYIFREHVGGNYFNRPSFPYHLSSDGRRFSSGRRVVTEPPQTTTYTARSNLFGQAVAVLLNRGATRRALELGVANDLSNAFDAPVYGINNDGQIVHLSGGRIDC